MTSVALVLKDRVFAGWIAPNEDADLEIAGSIFKSPSEGGFAGFHDWLRRGANVVGVRFWPHDGAALNGAVLPEYADIGQSPPCLTVFFVADRTFDESQSGDQAFAFSRLFRDQSGVLCLALDTETISSKQIEELGATLQLVQCAWA